MTIAYYRPMSDESGPDELSRLAQNANAHYFSFLSGLLNVSDQRYKTLKADWETAHKQLVDYIEASLRKE